MTTTPEPADFVVSPAGFDQLSGDVAVYGSARKQSIEIVTGKLITDPGTAKVVDIRDRIIKLTPADARELGRVLVAAADDVADTPNAVRPDLD
jgi:hypothetical protein